jgi:hypothetical protein
MIYISDDPWRNATESILVLPCLFNARLHENEMVEAASRVWGWNIFQSFSNYSKSFNFQFPTVRLERHGTPTTVYFLGFGTEKPEWNAYWHSVERLDTYLDGFIGGSMAYPVGFSEVISYPYQMEAFTYKLSAAQDRNRNVVIYDSHLTPNEDDENSDYIVPWEDIKDVVVVEN